MSIYGIGTHAYGDIYFIRTNGYLENWGRPQIIPSLKKKRVEGDFIRVFGDITPDWHEKTKTVLCTGKSFFSFPEDTINIDGNKRIDIETMQEVAYAIYKPSTDDWSELKSLALPKKLDNGDRFECVNSGCCQRFDLPDGNILLPVRYLKDKKYISTVILCSFDGIELTYIKHGSTFTIPEGRGLYEPSITCYQGEYFLTMRADESAYVAKSKDGLNYEPMKEWKFSDGSLLGNYNTQQHWISHSQGLYLIYTRRGGDNDHIFRHRAPLFIARVDADNLKILRETEQILIPIPEDSGDLGNFGVTHIDRHETWVTVAVSPKDVNDVNRQCNILRAKIKWK